MDYFKNTFVIPLLTFFNCSLDIIILKHRMKVNDNCRTTKKLTITFLDKIECSYF